MITIMIIMKIMIHVITITNEHSYLAHKEDR